MIHPFIDPHRRLRNGWWILLFLAGMAALVIPATLLAQARQSQVSMAVQLGIVVVVTAVFLAIRRESPSSILGAASSWRAGVPAGLALGVVIWGVAAGLLWITGDVSWVRSHVGAQELMSGLAASLVVAATEELVFRGFMFQRLVAGIGTIPAQLVMAAYFTLTHAEGLSQLGAHQALAIANIFIASLLFGQLFLRSGSLAMPMAAHFSLNGMQGSVLGLGISGHATAGILAPRFGDAPDWWTGGAFGLEASLPGTVMILLALVGLSCWRPRSTLRRPPAPRP